MILIITAAATAARIASTARLAQHIEHATLLSDDVLLACDQPIQRWLAEKSQLIALPPDVSAPTVQILHDRICTGDAMIEIAITAYDQLGMAPLGIASSGSPLRLSLPDDVIDAIDRIKLPKESALGLDLFGQMQLTDDLRIFPDSADTPRLEFGPSHAVDEPPDSGDKGDTFALCLGSRVSTHNDPALSASGVRPRARPTRINVNTAPVELVEAALRTAGRGGIEQIIAARTEARTASPGSPGSGGANLDDASQVQLVGASDVWSFRIDIDVDRVRRSWWAVYQKHRGDWHCVQRLAIDE